MPRSPRSLVGAVLRRTPPYRRLEQERAELATANHELRREARRRARPSDRDDLSYVFVVTYGRSGSTLLLGILHSTPGWLIRGENAGAVYWLHRHYKTIVDEPQSKRRAKPFPSTHPWFGFDGYPRKRARAAIRALIIDTLLRPEPDTRVTGFKEIRWNQPDLIDYLRFLQELFPGAKFVFNTRSLDQVAKSKWWAERDDAIDELARTEALQAEAAAALGPEAAFTVRYDDYVDDPASLRGLFEWLGEEFDEDRVRAVMTVPHSY
ncbi:MAG TPA: sulfotransferase [Marmoricola sp.]